MAVRRGAFPTAPRGPRLVLAVRCGGDRAAVRTWSSGGQILAIGLLDGPDLLRLTMAPEARRDDDLAQQLVEDINDRERGVLPPGKVSVEAPMDARVQDLLLVHGWKTRRAVDATAP